MAKGRFALASGAALLALALPASAGAATQIGQTFAPTNNCIDHVTIVQAFALNNAYTAPSAGVITSWSHRAPAAPGEIKLKVYRPAGGNNYTAVGESAFVTPLASQLNTYPAQVSVAAGDLLGLSTGAVSNPCTRNASSHQINFNGGYDPAPGMTIFMMPSPNDSQLDVSAVLEPDADNDGFGDETQDCAPGDASLNDDCAPPETTITLQPKKKTRKRRARLEFASSEAAAGFECSLDGAPFAACSSPHKLKVKRGRHHFEVRARDAAGNTDASPAAADWRVKRKRR